MQGKQVTRKRRTLTKNNKICNTKTIEILSSDDETQIVSVRKPEIIDLTSSDDETHHLKIKHMKDSNIVGSKSISVRISTPTF